MFNGLKVYTAYEFLERRFDGKTRTLTSFLFLLQRGLSTGISIYAPSIILSSLFGWDIYWTNIIMGGLLIIYTVAGGARAVAYTQKIQLVIIFFAMAMAGYMVVKLLPGNMGFSEALEVSGKLGKLNVITSGRNENGFNWNDRYNIWSGIIGGFFLALSYFGTDQSQVGRYLTAQNNTESRLGLLMNGLIKIPMQFSILLIGVLVFAFYQFNNAPLSFNDSLVNEVQQTSYKDSLTTLQAGFDSVNALKSKALLAYTNGTQTNTDGIRQLNKASEGYREAFKKMSGKATGKDTNDTNYVFLSFVKHHLPAGLKGLLIAVIFLAAWGSIAAALNSLAASTVCDFHQQIVGRGKPVDEYRISKWYTLAWGVFSILIAQSSSALGQSLIEAVNVLGSLFYGVILGIFLVAFYFKKINGTAVFIAAVIVECFVVVLFFNEQISFMNWLPDISFLWMNVIGAIGVVFVAALAEMIFPQKLKAVSTLQPSLSSLEE
jgi:Na+/proline symporter